MKYLTIILPLVLIFSCTTNQSNINESDLTYSPVEWFDYQVNDNNEIVIYGLSTYWWELDNSNKYEIVIPEYIEAKKVVEMKDFIAQNLKSIYINEHISDIEVNSLSFQDGSLEHVYVNMNNQNYCSENGILYSRDKTKLIFYPPSKRNREYRIPESVTTIEDYSFTSALYLKKVIIPASISNIGHMSFTSFNKLKEILVDSGNIVFQDIDGILYTKDNRLLLRYPSSRRNKSFTIPNEVEVVYSNSFKDSSYLKSIVWSDNITEIKSHAFNNCKSLFINDLPENLISIESEVFIFCNSIIVINIPTYVSEIDDTAFNFLYNIENINVAPENQQYASIDGVLYTKDISRLLFYPPKSPNEDFQVPESVIEINNSMLPQTIKK